MKTKSINILIVVCLVIIGGFMAYKFAKKKGKTGPIDDFLSNDRAANTSNLVDTPTTVSRPAVSTWGNYNDQFDPYAMAQKGEYSANTKKIQQALNRINELKKSPEIDVDGKFGAETEANLQKWLGKKSASYDMVMREVIRRYEAAGEPNPYETESYIETAMAAFNKFFGGN